MSHFTTSFCYVLVDKNMLFEALRLAYKYKNFDYLAPLIYNLHLEADIGDYIKEFGNEVSNIYLLMYSSYSIYQTHLYL